MLSFLTQAFKTLTRIINQLEIEKIERKIENYLTNDQYDFRNQKGTPKVIFELRVLIMTNRLKGTMSRIRLL